MHEELLVKIKSADIPIVLREYFMRKPDITNIINESLLQDIEDLYMELDSLYNFDHSIFSGYIINALKKTEIHDYFYYYLKKILDVNLEATSKFNPAQNIHLSFISNIDESDIKNNITKILSYIEYYNKTENIRSLCTAYRLTGITYVYLQLFPNNNQQKKLQNIIYILNEYTP